MPDWLQPGLTGLAFGTAVSALNHFILLRAVGRDNEQSPQKAKTAVLKGYFIRYFLNIAALLLVRNNTAMLIATALGLMFSKYMLITKHFYGNTRRKGVS